MANRSRSDDEIRLCGNGLDVFVVRGTGGRRGPAAGEPDARRTRGSTRWDTQLCGHCLTATLRIVSGIATRSADLRWRRFRVYRPNRCRDERRAVGGPSRHDRRSNTVIRTLCVATIVGGIALGLAVPVEAAPPAPNPAPYNPVFVPGQLPALRPSRGTQLPVLMSGPSRGPRISAGVDGVAVPGGVKPGVGVGDGKLESPTGAPPR